MLWPLCPQGKSSQYPLDRRLGEPQSRSERAGVETQRNGQSDKEKNSLEILCLSNEANVTHPGLLLREQPS
jgi:hypothetical protein